MARGAVRESEGRKTAGDRKRMHAMVRTTMMQPRRGFRHTALALIPVVGSVAGMKSVFTLSRTHQKPHRQIVFTASRMA
jgi:hypothetical protein